MKKIATILVAFLVMLVPVMATGPAGNAPAITPALIPTNFGWNFASITGDDVNINPGQSYTYTISLDAGTPRDDDPADGTYQERTGKWYFLDAAYNIIDEGDEVAVDRFYQETVTITAPSTTGDYKLVAMLLENEATYLPSTNSWMWGTWDIVEKDKLDINVLLGIPPSPPVPNFMQKLQELMEWLENLF